MGFLDRFLRTNAVTTPVAKSEDQAVLIYVKTDDLDASYAVEDELIALLEGSAVGEYDGNEIGGGELVIFLYGPDAELLFKLVEPTLRASEVCNGAKVLIRWGGPGAPQREVVL
jgi:hypothetical protein